HELLQVRKDNEKNTLPLYKIKTMFETRYAFSEKEYTQILEGLQDVNSGVEKNLESTDGGDSITKPEYQVTEFFDLQEIEPMLKSLEKMGIDPLLHWPEEESHSFSLTGGNGNGKKNQEKPAPIFKVEDKNEQELVC